MKKSFLIGFAIGALIVFTAAAIWHFQNRLPADSTQKIQENPEERYFDLRGRKEVLISLRDFIIEPANITVDKGTKIFWKNEGMVSHFVKFANGDFPEQEVKKREVISRIFEKPGIYIYNCGAHPNQMRGRITVE